MSNLKQKPSSSIAVIDFICLITKVKEYYYTKYNTNELPDDLDEYCECILSYIISRGVIGSYWLVEIPDELLYHANKLIEYSNLHKLYHTRIL